VGLLRAFGEGRAGSGGAGGEEEVPPVLVLLGELDPEDEILETNERFLGVWHEMFGLGDEKGRDGGKSLMEGGKGEGVEVKWMKGHNHISPPMALMAGDERGEAWGEDVAKWIKGLCSLEV